MEPQVTATINTKIDEIASMLRAEVLKQRDIWRTVPHWALEAQGRKGWVHNEYIIFEHRLYPLTGHLSPVYVDCYSGDLVNSRLEPAAAHAIVEVYTKMINWDALSVVRGLMSRATSDTRPLDDPNRQRNDRERESLRDNYSVTPVCVQPATPIVWGFNG